jgi:hypothetical protein
MEERLSSLSSLILELFGMAIFFKNKLNDEDGC